MPGGIVSKEEHEILLEKFIGSVRFGNDHLGAIMGYGEFVMGEIKAYCFVRDLNGNRYLKGCHGTPICTRYRCDEMMKSSRYAVIQSLQCPSMVVCIVVYNHLNFGTLIDLAPEKIWFSGVPTQIEVEKDHLLLSLVQLGKSKKFYKNSQNLKTQIWKFFIPFTWIVRRSNESQSALKERNKSLVLVVWSENTQQYGGVLKEVSFTGGSSEYNDDFSKAPMYVYGAVAVASEPGVERHCSNSFFGVVGTRLRSFEGYAPSRSPTHEVPAEGHPNLSRCSSTPHKLVPGDPDRLVAQGFRQEEGIRFWKKRLLQLHGRRPSEYHLPMLWQPRHESSTDGVKFIAFLKVDLQEKSLFLVSQPEGC
ncbi:hypothetical protein Tco_0108872 [Tanacetum coccineum]